MQDQSNMQLPHETKQHLRAVINDRHVDYVCIEIHILYPICYECGTPVRRELITQHNDAPPDWQCENESPAGIRCSSRDWIHGGERVIHEFNVAQFLNMLHS